MPIENKMNNIMLGTWGLAGQNKISNLSLGWPIIENNVISDILDRALKENIKWIEMSDFYGKGFIEQFVGNKFKNNRENIKYATKGGIIPKFTDNYGQLKKDFSPEYLNRALNKSLNNLQTDYLDLYQLHGANLNTLKKQELQVFLQELKTKNKVRSIGVSIGSKNVIQNLEAISQYDFIDYVQLSYSIDNPKMIYAINNWKEKYLGNLNLIGRSIFLHGLFTKETPSLIRNLDDHRSRKYSNKLIEKVIKFKNIVNEEFSMTLKDAILLFSINNKNINSVVIGATQKKYITEWSLLLKEKQINKDFSNNFLKIANEVFTDESI
ncbi:aldo/keto reductase [Halarcobacter sp.]|uniref:aldo/keto reductase n=1 Tax=Halarcobacter sp. TaxID=2321133 RepID=UPI003A9261BE